MAFKKADSEKLLSVTGRLCCICGKAHGVSLHHIIPKEEGGKDDIDNAIPLCPNCHDEVHGSGARGRTTRAYSAEELRLHRERTIELVLNGTAWRKGSDIWEKDKALILFYAQCLDRPAFRTGFNVETNFSDFDRAMEDTQVALSTGYSRLRDGTVVERMKGKAHVVHGPWRAKLDEITKVIEEVRTRFREATGFTRMPYQGSRHNHFPDDMLMDRALRGNASLVAWMDEQRERAIQTMNAMLKEIGHPPLRGIHEW
jgi:hypothetical protein